MAAIVALALLLQATIAALLAVVGVTTDALWLDGLVNTLAFGTVLMWTWRRSPPRLLGSLSNLDRRGDITRSVAAVVVTMTGAQFVASEIDMLATSIVAVPRSLYWIRETPAATTLEYIAVYGVVAASTEELLFRGVFMERLLPHRSVRLSVLWSALLFAIAHLDPWGFPATFLVGVYLGYVYAITRSAILCILGHATFNLIPGEAMPGHSASFAEDMIFRPGWMSLVGLLIMTAGFALTAARARAAKTARPGQSSPRRP